MMTTRPRASRKPLEAAGVGRDEGGAVRGGRGGHLPGAGGQGGGVGGGAGHARPPLTTTGRPLPPPPAPLRHRPGLLPTTARYIATTPPLHLHDTARRPCPGRNWPRKSTPRTVPSPSG